MLVFPIEHYGLENGVEKKKKKEKITESPSPMRLNLIQLTGEIV